MTSYEEFRFIAAQLNWLERQLHAHPLPVDIGSMQRAMEALTCAKAVIEELVTIGDAAGGVPAWLPVAKEAGHVALQ